MEITTNDKLLQEIGIIETIFHAQFSVYNDTDFFPSLLDNTGTSGINGKYIHNMDIFSNVELFNLQRYKKDITERFEKAVNLTLLQSQLKSIKERATDVRDFYNENLTDKSKAVKEFLRTKTNLPFEKERDLTEQHSAVITISDYRLGEIYLGSNRVSRPCFWSDQKYSFNYIFQNHIGAFFCQEILSFIDDFNLIKKDNAGPIKSFPEYLLYENRDNLANMLKKEFKNEKGRTIMLMLEVLKQHDQPLIILENRQQKVIYNALKDYFGHYIGSYQSVFDKKFDTKKDKIDFEAVKTKIAFILKSIT